VATASITGKIIENSDLLYNIEAGQLALVQYPLSEILSNIHDENQLQGVYVVDETNRVIASSRNLLSPGDALPFLEEDSTASFQALTGSPAAAPMQVIAGSRFKSAYAPVKNTLGDVVAIVAVQASAGFFELIGIFQRGIILGGVVAVLLVILFSAFLFWAIKLLIKTHESLRQSERLAAMGQMAATVAHEIRNPLGIIKGAADVLTSKYSNPDEPDELFEYIPSEVRRLNRLVSDFLTFARDRELETDADDLQKSVEKTLISLKDEIQSANVKLVEEFEELPPVRHEEDAINQLVLNLGLNAIQAMKDGGALTVRLKNERRKGRQYARVEIEDTGCGFEVDKAKIFEPFYTTKTNGSGLGLAICNRLVEKHGGWFEVDSEPGKGTSIRFYLPV
jgi:signal transduction histidine kinase